MKNWQRLFGVALFILSFSAWAQNISGHFLAAQDVSLITDSATHCDENGGSWNSLTQICTLTAEHELNLKQKQQQVQLKLTLFGDNYQTCELRALGQRNENTLSFITSREVYDAKSGMNKEYQCQLEIKFHTTHRLELNGSKDCQKICGSEINFKRLTFKQMSHA
jgi:hypothetical protein